MAEIEPTVEVPDVSFASPETLRPWADARARLSDGRTYWLSTVRRDGRPHVAPVWAVWLDGALYFSTAATSRKARNLAVEPRCAVNLESGEFHLMLEGRADRVTEEAKLRRMAETYSAKYDWPLHVRDGAVSDEYGNSGPVFVVTPSVVFGFIIGETESATKWVFPGG